MNYIENGNSQRSAARLIYQTSYDISSLIMFAALMSYQQLPYMMTLIKLLKRGKGI
jgi:hypothetical protein